MTAPVQTSVHPKNHGQGCRDEKKIIQMPTNERGRRHAFEPPTIERVGSRTDQEHGVAEIPKPIHSKSSRIQPEAIARRSLRKTIMIGTVWKRLKKPSGEFSPKRGAPRWFLTTNSSKSPVQQHFATSQVDMDFSLRSQKSAPEFSA